MKLQDAKVGFNDLFMGKRLVRDVNISGKCG